MERGQVFEIPGKKFFTFGGARSHDISSGILNPSEEDFERQYYRLNKLGASFRVLGESWWPEEMPSEKEMEEGQRNLELHNNKVDYIITHCAPSSDVGLYGQGLYKTDELTDYFQGILLNIDFTKWFYGHYHEDRYITDKTEMLCNSIKLLP